MLDYGAVTVEWDAVIFELIFFFMMIGFIVITIKLTIRSKIKELERRIYLLEDQIKHRKNEL